MSTFQWFSLCFWPHDQCKNSKCQYFISFHYVWGHTINTEDTTKMKTVQQSAAISTVWVPRSMFENSQHGSCFCEHLFFIGFSYGFDHQKYTKWLHHGWNAKTCSDFISCPYVLHHTKSKQNRKC